MKILLKRLINFHLFDKLGEIKYPKRILPRKKYKLRIDFDKYIHTKKFVLIRRSNRSPSDAFDEGGMLRFDALINDLKDVPNLSMNLYGAKYRLQYLGYVPKGKATKPWEKKSSIKKKDFKDSFEYNCDVYPIYFVLNDITNNKFPYQRIKDKFVSDVYKLLYPTVQIGDYIEAIGITKVAHVPIMLNYWHVEFIIKDFKDDKGVKRSKIRGDNGGFNSEYWQNKLAQNALENILIMNAKKEFPESVYTKIRRKIYCD